MAQESPLLETSLIAPVDTLMERIGPTHIEPSIEELPLVDEIPIVVEVSRAVTESGGDRCPRLFHQFQDDLLTLREKATTMREAILQQNEELEVMRAVCAKSVTKLTHVGKRLDSLMVQLECTLEHQSNPLQTYIDGACITGGLPLHIGEGEAESP